MQYLVPQYFVFSVTFYLTILVSEHPSILLYLKGADRKKIYNPEIANGSALKRKVEHHEHHEHHEKHPFSTFLAIKAMRCAAQKLIKSVDLSRLGGAVI